MPFSKRPETSTPKSSEPAPRGLVIARAAATGKVMLAARVKASDRVLDVCCGKGTVAFALAPHCSYVTGIDFIEDLLAEAQALAIERGLANVSFQQSDVHHIPFENASFDCVVNQLALHHLKHPEAVLWEMVRVLKSPGRLAIVDVVASEDKSLRDGQNKLESMRDPDHVEFLSPSAIIKMVTDAGLEIVDRELWEVERDADEWLDAERVPLVIREDPSKRDKIKKAMRQAAKAKSTSWKIVESGHKIEFRQTWMLVVGEKLG